MVMAQGETLWTALMASLRRMGLSKEEEPARTRTGIILEYYTPATPMHAGINNVLQSNVVENYPNYM